MKNLQVKYFTGENTPIYGIYFIFKTFRRVSKLFSDQGLFILISSIVSVKIIMLVIWASLDAPRVIDVKQFVFDSETVPPFFFQV